MEIPPFLLRDQLCTSILFDECKGSVTRTSRSETPKTPKTTLPGQARIELESPLIASHLETEFLTPKLAQFAPYLWLVAKQDSAHISSLTHQAVRGRSIILTENPELHLTWIHDRIYLKPIPRYILSHSFWKYYLLSHTSPISAASRGALVPSIKGFLRSYAYLVRHKSDFCIAQSPDNVAHRLLPKGIRYTEFIQFISKFEDISDSDVSDRYTFGELRLSRLNFWSPVVLHHTNFQKVYADYGTYFSRFFGPFLYVWACLSLALGAFQLLAAIQPYYTTSRIGNWKVLDRVAKGFSIATIAGLLLASATLLLLMVGLFLREFLFALRDLMRRRRQTKPSFCGLRRQQA